MKCNIQIFFVLLFIATTANAGDWSGKISGKDVTCKVEVIHANFGIWQSFDVSYTLEGENSSISYTCIGDVLRFPGNPIDFSCSTLKYYLDTSNWSGQENVYIYLKSGTRNAQAKICQDFHLKAQLKNE